MADAVNLRHRHPALWQQVMDGHVADWVARKTARLVAAAELTLDQARWVDAVTAPYAATLPAGRYLTLVEARIIEADPGAAQARGGVSFEMARERLPPTSTDRPARRTRWKATDPANSPSLDGGKALVSDADLPGSLTNRAGVAGDRAAAPGSRGPGLGAAAWSPATPSISLPGHSV